MGAKWVWWAWVFSLATAAPAWAGSFDNAVNAVQMRASVHDATGVTVRGGVNLSTGAQTSALFNANVQIGGGCGAFNFQGSIKEAFEEIPQMLEDLAWGVVRALPMVIICSMEPVVCDIAKDINNYLNVLINARYAQCQNTQNAAIYAGLRLRGGQVSQCLSQQSAQGVGIERAMRLCNEEPFNLRNPDGSFGAEVHLIQDTLRAAGANQETQQLAQAFLGDVTMQAGNPFRISSQSPLEAMFGRYDEHKQKYGERLNAAVATYQASGTVPEATLRSLSVPGQPMPGVAIEKLAVLRTDPVRYDALVGSLSTAAAFAQVTSDCHDLQNQIQAAADGNQHLSEPELAAIKKKLERLRMGLAQMEGTIGAAEKHSAALDKVFVEYAKTEQMVSRLGVSAPAIQIQVPPARFTTQQPLGYAR
jgi:hypothetical protein